MAPQFADISKPINDLFDRSGFGTDKKIKQSFKTPPVFGGAISVSQEIKGIDNFEKGFAGKISAKWKHACGFSVDKFDNDVKKGTILETSYSVKGVDGLSVACKYSKKSTGLESSYASDVVAATVSTTSEFKAVSCDVALSTEGLTVGTSLAMGPKGLGDTPISLAYSGGSYVAAIEATDSLKTFTLLGSYNASKDLSLATKFMVPDGGKQKCSLVGVYKLGDEFNTKVAGMYSMASGFGKSDSAAVDIAVTAKPLSKVETGCALTIPTAKPECFSYGLTFTLG